MDNCSYAADQHLLRDRHHDYYREHGRPHFHARYAGREATVALDTLEVLAGSLPARAVRLVHEWATVHSAELEANWDRARSDAPLVPITPLP